MSAALALASGLLSFAVALAWAPWLIGTLRRLRVGKQIRLEGPSSHAAKAGTPTMGGWLFVATTAVLALLLVGGDPGVRFAVAAMLAFALLGALDDLANVRSRSGLGFRVRAKVAVHTAVGLILAAALALAGGAPALRLPGGAAFDLGWWFVPLGGLALFATTAAVNETDGLDGLAGGCAVLALVALAALTLGSGQPALATLCALGAGATLAFLWHNVHPATVFMGDTGALGLGALLAAVALASGWLVLLPVVGVVFVAETASVLLQVAYFKLTRGRRLFLMSPLHHHCELSGWPEVRVVQRFWIVAAAGGLAGVALGQL
ncbi:MAG: phospho-N-acetylmuramoyl-pentapeptide-transferase [Chloroflexi bacterium]|nr:phospho-N-acetylmuramoyl-pentapeptide-transferase [Chloroflexota bacterium]